MKTRSPLLSVSLIAALGSALLLATTPSQARDRFEYDPTPVSPSGPSKSGSTKSGASKSSGSSSSSTHATVIAVGEVREVYDAASDASLAFYIPAPGTAVAQVMIEKKFLRKPVYLVKGLRPGTVTGGLVPRASLDATGFKPKNITEEARIREALKARPITLIVR